MSGPWQDGTTHTHGLDFWTFKDPRAQALALLPMKSGVLGSEWALRGEEGIKCESKRMVEKPDREVGKAQRVALHARPKDSQSRCGPVSVCSCCL